MLKTTAQTLSIYSMLALAAGAGAHAEDYPGKTIRMVVQSPTGGGTDLLARIIGRKLTEIWGQNVVADNRAGAGGILGTEIVAHAIPDGYTLLMVPSTHAINPSIYKKLPYDTVKDFAAIGQVAISVNVLVVHPALPAQSVPQFIALSRTQPGQLTFGSAGVGSTTHLAAELFKSVAQIDAVHVPYKGSGPAEIDLAGGHLSFMVDSLPAALPNVRSGKTRALATTGSSRSQVLPGVPTVIESGLSGYESKVWWGILAPAGTPQAIVAKLNREIVRIMEAPDVRDLVLVQGAESRPGSPREFTRFIESEIAQYARIVKAAGIVKAE